MSNHLTRRRFGAYVAAVAGLSMSRARAQAPLPKGPITLVVPFAAGGATDGDRPLVAPPVA